MSDHYEYYLNNPHEKKVMDSYITAMDENRDYEIEEAADEENFVYDLIADQYVDFDLTSTTLRAMFKSYCNRMNATKQEDKDTADKDLLLFTKSLMSAMYDAAGSIIDTRNEQEIMMLDNLLILCLGGAIICAIFVVTGIIAKIRGWE